MDHPRQPATFLCEAQEIMKALKFAGKLETFRRLKGLTVAALAANVGVDADTMERLLSGKNAPNALNLKKIERGLGIEFEPEDFEEYADGR